MKIPGLDEWGGYSYCGNDLDTEYAFKTFFGKSLLEAEAMFHDHPTERTEDLRWMPPHPFRYYILAFKSYLLSDKSLKDPDAASCYLECIEQKIMEQPKTIDPIFEILEDSIHHVADNQAFYDADEGIYGDFQQLRDRILTAFSAYKAEVG